MSAALNIIGNVARGIPFVGTAISLYDTVSDLHSLYKDYKNSDKKTTSSSTRINPFKSSSLRPANNSYSAKNIFKSSTFKKDVALAVLGGATAGAVGAGLSYGLSSLSSSSGSSTSSTPFSPMLASSVVDGFNSSNQSILNLAKVIDTNFKNIVSVLEASTTSQLLAFVEVFNAINNLNNTSIGQLSAISEVVNAVNSLDTTALGQLSATAEVVNAISSFEASFNSKTSSSSEFPQSIELKVPTEGVKMVVPTEGVKMVAPTEGVKMVAPTEGVKMVAPTEGVNMVAPTEGVNMVAPTEGVNMVAPTEGVKMVAPTEGVKMVAPTEGVKMVAPTEGVPIKATFENKFTIPENSINLNITPVTPNVVNNIDFSSVTASLSEISKSINTPERLKNLELSNTILDYKSNPQKVILRDATATSPKFEMEFKPMEMSFLREAHTYLQKAEENNIEIDDFDLDLGDLVDEFLDFVPFEGVSSMLNIEKFKLFDDLLYGAVK